VHRKCPFDVFPTRCNITQFIYFWKTALHVSGGISTHHQEHTQLYLQYLVLVKPLLLPAAMAAGSSARTYDLFDIRLNQKAMRTVGPYRTSVIIIHLCHWLQVQIITFHIELHYKADAQDEYRCLGLKHSYGHDIRTV